jgi:Fe-S cluster biogenesis protein NfuA
LKIISREETPNPAALKFNLNGPVVANGYLSFSSGDEDDEYTGDNALARALFKLGVSDIYLCQNSVSVTMASYKAWEFFLDDVIIAIETHLVSPGQEPQKARESILNTIDRETFPNLQDRDKVIIIDSLFDEIIRPALANDGGGLEVLAIEGNQVQIKYQGACGSCPTSTTGTLKYIDGLMKQQLHPELTVVPA